MADTTTTNYGLTKPEVGASEDTWGTKLNTNLDTIDTKLDSIEGKSGAGTLKHTDVAKLTTTTTGIDVTGTATMDGLTVDGVSGNMAVFNGTLGDVIISADGAAVLFTRPSTTYLRASDAIGNLSIQAGGNINRALFANNGDISFYEDTGTTAKFFWDASTESLGIGTASPAGQLELERQSNANYTGAFAFEGAALQITDSSNSTTYPTASAQLQFKVGSTGVAEAYIGGYRESANTSSLIFGTQSGATRAERMRITSSGNVGIGTTAPFSRLHLSPGGAGDQGEVAITLGNETGSARGGQIIKDTSAPYNMTIVAGLNAAVGSALVFNTNPTTEAARIDVSGNLLVGRTANFSGAKVELQTNDNVTTLTLNKNNINDGEMLRLAKTGNTVSSIGTFSAGNSYFKGDSTSHSVGAGDTGVQYNATNDQIRPYNITTGATRTDAIDIGGNGARFKDLYLSGGVYVGGTGAANHLDDYETGTWTPTTVVAPSSGTVSSAEGNYTKVGNLVTLTLRITGTGLAIASFARFSGIPFTPATNKEGSGYYTTNSISANAGGEVFAVSDSVYLGAGGSSSAYFQVSVTYIAV